MSFTNLYRLPDEGFVAGVCAGLAHRFDWNAWTIRLLWLVALFIFTKIAALTYILASILLPTRRKSDFSTDWKESALGNMQDEFNAIRSRLKQ